MPTYQTPGVYVEEVSSGEKPIAGVGTGTGGFVGIAQRGPIGKAILITNMTQYKNIFGDYVNDWIMPYAVEQFFKEGGSKCYVVRTVAYDNAANRDINLMPNATKASLTLKDGAATPADCLKIEATSVGQWGNDLNVEIQDGVNVASQFVLIIKNGNTDIKTYSLDISDLTNKPISKQIETQGKSTLFDITHLTATRPANKAATSLSGGNNILDGLTIADFVGSAAETGMNGLHAFDSIDDVNLIAMPDMHFVDNASESDTINGIKEAIIYCNGRQDCFFVADVPMGKSPSEALSFKQNNGISSSYAAIYYPWIKANFGSTTITLPPSGAVMGVISRTDRFRGVFKAPAGIIDGKLNTVIGLERNLTNGEQESLNPQGVNVLRFFPGPGNVVWGARTCASGIDAEWQYINIRRYFMYVEESLDEGSQWVVFEPNTPSLWGNIKRNFTAFLTREWRSGALFGNTAEEAFYVKVDAENNPPDVRALGQLIIEVGIAPVRPAEFVIIRISQKTAVA